MGCGRRVLESPWDRMGFDIDGDSRVVNCEEENDEKTIFNLLLSPTNDDRRRLNLRKTKEDDFLLLLQSSKKSWKSIKRLCALDLTFLELGMDQTG